MKTGCPEAGGPARNIRSSGETGFFRMTQRKPADRALYVQCGNRKLSKWSPITAAFNFRRKAIKPGANESLRPPLYAAPGFIAQLQKLRSALQKYYFVEVFRPKRAWNFVEVQKYGFFIIADWLSEFTNPTICINMIIGSLKTLKEGVTIPT